MLYDNYQKKINRAVKVLSEIRRFRVLIICVLAVMLALMVAFFATKGITFGESDLPGEIQYGNAYEYSAKGFLSRVRYEYSVEGSGIWTSEQPTAMGKYLVRAVANGVFGERYGDERLFVITPRDLVVSVDQKTVKYGENPDVKANGLMNEDYVVCSGFTYGSFATDITEISPVKEEIVVMNKAGVDVTSSYNIKVKQGEISFTPRDITLTVADVTIQYNGKPLVSTVHEISRGNLAFRDNMTTAFYASQTEVGSTVNEPRLTILNKNAEDVTRFYNVTTEAGELTVEYRVVVVESEGKTFVYNGEAQEHREYHMVETNASDGAPALIEGHRLVLDSATPITNVGDGELKNMMNFSVVDAEGKDVTDLYYTVQVNPGTLKVDPRPVTITAASDSKVYDGTALINQNYTASENGLIEGHEVTSLGGDSSVTNLGSVANVVDEKKVVIKDADGNNVSDNYQVTGVDGTLTIEIRKISVQSASGSAAYNGQPFSCPNYEITDGSLAEGEKLEIEYREVTEISENVENTFTVKVFSGKNETTGNYQIHRTPGKLTVFARPITIKAGSEERMYDGNELTLKSATDNNDVSVGGDDDNGIGLAPGHTFDLTMNGAITNVGSTENRIVSVIICDENGKDVTRNYAEPILMPGTLTITHRPLTIQADDGKKEYDGKELKVGTYTTKGLVEGHKVDLLMTDGSTITDYTEGGVVNKINESTVTITVNGEPVKDNYTITYEPGTLTIEKRKVTITADDVKKVYNGNANPTEGAAWQITGSGFVLGHSITANVMCSTANVYVEGEDNAEEWYTYLENIQLVNGGDINNYDITPAHGTLTITPRKVTVTAYDAGQEYNGTALTCDIAGYQSEEKDEGLLDEHDLHVTMTERSRATHVRESGTLNEVDPSKTKVYDKAGAPIPVTNYDFKYTPGTLTITPRSVTIQVTDVIKIYDGTNLPKNHSYDWKVTSGSFASVDTFEADVVCSEVNVSTDGETNLENQQLFGVGEFEDYDLTIISGTLKVDPRPVIITAASDSKVYDGTELTCPDFTWETQNGDRGLVNGQSITELEMTADSTITNYIAGGVLNVIDKDSIVIMSGDEDVTDNYEIECETGTLTIIKRVVTIWAGSAEKTYDGTELTCPDFTWETQNGDRGLVDEQSITALEMTADSTITYVWENDVLNVIDKSSIVIMSGDEDVTYNYEIECETGTLTIEKRSITITTATDTKVYDGTKLENGNYTYNKQLDEDGQPHNDGLVTGETIAVTMTDDSHAVNVKDGAVLNRVGSLTIKSGTLDVTANYAPIYKEGTLTITPRKVTITAHSDSKTYDGTELRCEEYDVESENGDRGLVAGQTLKAEMTAESVVLHVEDGIVPNVIDEKNGISIYVTLTNEPIDLENYDFDCVDGTLEITVRYITIQVYDFNKVYDGTNRSDENPAYEITSGSFVEEFSADVICATANVCTDAEAYLTNMQLAGRGTNLSDYEITQVRGKATITPRKVTILAGSAEKTYDGTELTCPDFTWETQNGDRGLVNGQEITALDMTADSTITNYIAGGVLNVIDKDSIVIMSGDEDVTDNYEIECETGTLTIIKRQLTITAGSAEKTYDGTELTCPDFTWETQNGDRGLVDEQSITALEMTADSTITNYIAGGVLNVIDKSSIVIMSGDEDVTYNYEIECETGTLTIIKRQVFITVEDYERVYDGTTNIYDQDGYLVAPFDEEGKSGVIGGQELNALLLVGTTADASDNRSAAGPWEVVVDKDSLVVWTTALPTENMTDNYEFVVTPGKLTITRRQVTVTVGDIKKVYDDTLDVKDADRGNYEVEAPTGEFDGLVSGHLFDAIVVCSTKHANLNQDAINAGEEWYSTLSGITITSGGSSVTENYAVHVTGNYGDDYGGNLIIEQRSVTVKAGSAEKVYDGTPLKCPDFKASEQEGDRGILSGHITRGSTTGQQTDVGESENYVNGFTVLDKDRRVVTGNYIITESLPGTLTVTERLLKLILDDATKIYDGTVDLDNNFFNWQVDISSSDIGLVGEDKLSVIVECNRADAGSGEDWYTIVKAGSFLINGEISRNYTLSFTPGQLTIRKRQVFLSIDTSYERVYDGTDKVYDPNIGYTITAPNAEEKTGLLPIHVWGALPEIVTSTIHAGEGDDWRTVPGTDFIVLDETDADVAKNYDFVIANGGGALKITPREVSVWIGEITRPYDGTTVYKGAVAAEEENGDRGIVANDFATATVRGDVYFGTTTNLFIQDGSVVMKNSRGEEINGNYIVTVLEQDPDGLEENRLTITPRPLYITTDNASKEYDGEALTKDSYKVEGTIDGHTATITVTGSHIGNPTEETSDSNTYDPASLRITDKDGNEIDPNTGMYYTEYYVIKGDTLGNLVVRPEGSGEEEGEGEGEGGRKEKGEYDENLDPLYVPLAGVIYRYDGTFHGYTNNHWSMPTNLPDGWRFTLNLEGGLIDAGVIDLAELAVLNHYNFHVYDDNGKEVFDYRLQFVGEPLRNEAINLYPKVNITNHVVDGKVEHTCILTESRLLTGHVIDTNALIFSFDANGNLDLSELVASIKIKEGTKDVTSNYYFDESSFSVVEKTVV